MRSQEAPGLSPWVYLSLLTLACFIFLKTAWIGDDAAISLRYVLNAIHGFGLRFNVDERVQAFTHPLWVFLLIGLRFIIPNVFYVTFFLSISLSLLNLFLLLHYFSKNRWQQFLAVLVLLCSKSYLDFSVSGLENPLSSFLFLLGLHFVSQRENLLHKYTVFLGLFFLFALYLSRPDHLLMVLPLIALVLYRLKATGHSTWIIVLLCSSPFWLWTFFSLFYYGFPFPNTAYAKLATGIPYLEKWQQGWHYFEYSFYLDPLLFTVLTLGGLYGFRGNAEQKCLSLGLFLYLFYILSIGGDFMAGRFFTLPLLAALLILMQTTLRKAEKKRLVFLLIGTSLLHPSHFTTLFYKQGQSPYRVEDSRFYHGVVDERAYYFQEHGLWPQLPHGIAEPPWPSYSKDLKYPQFFLVNGTLGYFGLKTGPATHVIDLFGLSDPLLARLPLRKNLRIGHFMRLAPAGYLQSLAQHKNFFKDPQIANYYALLQKAITAPLWNLSRFKSIFSLNQKTQPPIRAHYQHESMDALNAFLPPGYHPILPIYKVILTP